MKRLTVLIDIDDTIENLCEAWCKWLNKKHGLNVSPEKITDWDISRFFSDLTSEEIFSPLLSEDFWETVTPKPDAVKYLSALHSEGFNLFLCSATDYRVVRTKYEKIISETNEFKLLKEDLPYLNEDYSEKLIGRTNCHYLCQTMHLL